MLLADFWAEARSLPVGSRAELTGNEAFVVLSPHPDDETLGLGGLIHQARAAGQQVDVVMLTDGAGSHTHSVAYPAPRLVELRKQEVLEAAEILGLTRHDLHHLDLPDAHLPSRGPVFDQTVRKVVELVQRRSAQSLFVTWEHDPHCDHQAAAAIAAAVVHRLPALRLWAYPIWGWHRDPSDDVPGPPRGLRLDIVGEAAIKRRAIAAHRSQMTDLIKDDPAGFRFTAKTLAPFLAPYEYFFRIR